MPSQPAALAIGALTIGYHRRGRLLRVVSDVSLEIMPGEAYGLVGESGCGKTTIAMAVMRYLPENAVVEAGRMLFHGEEDLLTASEAKLRRLRGDRMAMVYQDPGSALNPSLTAGRQIAEVYEFHRGLGKAEAMEAARAMLETVQISDPHRVLRRYPHELSGGQQQRIMFAMALATDPDLLVLDEPTTGLDATVEAEVLDLVAQLRTQFNASILFISHNLGIVARMCERVGVLYAGRLIEEGPADELFADPRHPYTLALLRCVPRLGMRKGLRRLDPIPGSLPPLGAAAPGCVYAPRCPLARARCRAEPPPSLPVGDGRSSRCFFHAEVPTIPAAADAGARDTVAAGSDVLLRVEDLVKTYRSGAAETTAVARVSLALGRGEVLGLVGESGSGKSSLARCIIGLIDPSSGEIAFDGAMLDRPAAWRRPELRRKLQMVFQNPDTALNPSHKVRHILGRAVKLLSDTGSGAELDERVAALAAAVRLRPQHLELRPAMLSGGLKQRVAIARAFAGSPALVLCDEPTSALDVSVQAAILNLLADLQATQGVAYVLISHDLGVVRYLADRIAVMYLGQVVEIGPAGAVFNPPHHPYTEALLSAMPTIGLGEQRTRIKLGGTMPSPSNPPSGCRFHTRCPRFLGEVCRAEEPPWQEDEVGHRYRCHIAPAELRRAQRAAEPELKGRQG
ncbi:MAG: ABC transporter ATP-binding protein [Alphaproteobacteria bacterium]|nr:ABC transporter ATP-binding protein [Alphaproteobacteria bacterium]